MPRYVVKDNDVMFGIEFGGLRTISSVTPIRDQAPTTSDVGFVMNLESLTVSDLKPKQERLRQWYVGTKSRQKTYTYESEYKVGSGSLSGPLKYGHLIDSILGSSTQAVDQTTYDELAFDGGGDGRKSLFCIFNHGDNRSMAIMGILPDEVKISGAEGEFVKIDATIQSAKMIDLKYVRIYGDADLSSGHDWTTPDTFSIDVNGTGPDVVTLNAACTTIAGVVSHINAALVTAGVVGAIAYAANNLYVAIKTTENSSSEEIVLAAGGGTALTTLGWTAGAYNNDNIIPEEAQIDKSIPPYHWKHVGIELSIGGDIVTTDDEGITAIHGFKSGVEVESFEVGITNKAEYKFGAPNTGGQKWSNWYKELEFDGSLTLVIYPTDDLYWILSPSENQYSDQNVGVGVLTLDALPTMEVGEKVTGDSSGATGIVIAVGALDITLKQVSGEFTTAEGITGSFGNADTVEVSNFWDNSTDLQINCVITLSREGDGEVNDHIIIDMQDIEFEPISEDLSDISAGVDPVTITANLAKDTSSLIAYENRRLHDNSSSYPY